MNDEDGAGSLWEYVVGGGLWIGFLKGINAFNALEVLDVQRRTSGSWITTIMLGFPVLVLITGYTAVPIEWAPTRRL